MNAVTKLGLVIVFLLNLPCLSKANLSADIVNVSDSQTNDGSIDLHVNGGFSPYTFQWTGPAGFSSNLEDINNLAAGSYSVVVTDALCGIAELSVLVCSNITISEPQISEPTACNSSDGSIYFRFGGPAGGVYPYAYLWNNGETSLSISNIPPGSYTVTITDNIGCSIERSYDLSYNDAPEIYEIITEGCEGAEGGSIELIIVSTNPNPDFSILWSTGSTSDEITNVSPGNYSVTVTDNSNGCFSVNYFDIEAIPNNGPAEISANITNSCLGESSGEIELSLSGTTPPITINWPIAGNDNERILSGLLPGNYCVTITDRCGVYEDCYDVGTNPPIIVTPIITNACQGDDGAMELNVSGGTPPYSFDWEGLAFASNGSTTNSLIDNLASDDYRITVTDALGCVTFENVVIDGLRSETQTITEGCLGERLSHTGSIQPVVIGGSSPYSFIWEDGSTNQTLNNAEVGSHMVTITDASGCFIERSYNVPNGLEVETFFSVENNNQLTTCISVESCPNGSSDTSFETPVTYTAFNPSAPCIAGTIFCPITGAELGVANGEFIPGDIIGEPNPFTGECVMSVTCQFSDPALNNINIQTSMLIDDCRCADGNFLTSFVEEEFFPDIDDSCCGTNFCEITTVICTLTGQIMNETCVPIFPIVEPNEDSKNDSGLEEKTVNRTLFIQKIYPNPFYKVFTVEIFSSEDRSNLAIKLVDVLGQVVFHEINQIDKGLNIIAIHPKTNLPSGIYTLFVEDNKNRASLRVINSRKS